MASTFPPPQAGGRAPCLSWTRCNVALALSRFGRIRDALDHSATRGPNDKLRVDTIIHDVSAKRKPQP